MAGTLIIVRGFEAIRYLHEHFDGPTRIGAARWSRYFSLTVYVVFVALAQQLLAEPNGECCRNFRRWSPIRWRRRT